jgi:hypothetical protein
MMHKVDVYFGFDNEVMVYVDGKCLFRGPKEEVSFVLKDTWDVAEKYGKPGIADVCKRAWIKINYSPFDGNF